MQIVEVKNNLVKISYDTSNLILSGFITINDQNQSFIGQVINLDANAKGKFAIVKLMFNFNDDGVITNYNGSIPAVSSSVTEVQSQELLELLPARTPIYFGELAQQNTALNLDINIFENKLLVCSEKQDDNQQLIENLVTQISAKNKKVVVLDVNGDTNLTKNKIVAGESFKLPLNYSSINFIYNNLEDATAEAKALIQDIFLEVQQYVETLPEKYLPFETFKSVVDSQYEELNIVQLLLLKNKLLKYEEAGIFAQERQEFDSLRENIDSEEVSVFDLSKVDGNVQREMISYAFSLMKNLDKDFYVILNVKNDNSNKKLLKQIFTTKNVFSTLICSYSFKYINELKQLSKNTIMFAPIQQQNDFGIYNIFVNKLNPHEFVIYGYATHHIPFIIKLEKIELQTLQEEIQENAQKENSQPIEIVQPIPPVMIPTPPTKEELLDQEIKRDVDQIFTAPIQTPTQAVGVEEIPIETQAEEPQIQEPQVETEYNQDMFSQIPEEDTELTEDDLDFIDNIDGDFEEISEDVPQENNEIMPEIAEEPEIVENIQENDENQFSKIVEEDQTSSFSDVLSEQEDETPPPALDILPASMSSTPIVPIYSADIEPQAQSDEIQQGDVVTHAKYGKGTVEKLINYGSKTLCSINFDNVGRRLLDPNLAELKKI